MNYLTFTYVSLLLMSSYCFDAFKVSTDLIDIYFNWLFLSVF